MGPAAPPSSLAAPRNRCFDAYSPRHQAAWRSLNTMREVAVEDGSRQNSGIAAPGQEAERGSLRGICRCIRCCIPGKGSTAIMRGLW